MQESEPPDDDWREPRLVMDPGRGARIHVFVWVSPIHTTQLMTNATPAPLLAYCVGSPVWSAVTINLILGTEPY